MNGNQRLFSLVIEGLSFGSALAEQLVRLLPNVGSCLLGFDLYGNDCLSSPGNHREAMEKSGQSCPLGWFSSGDSCMNGR